jgi:hypothetical protein
VRVPAILLVATLVVTSLGWGLFVHEPAPSKPEQPSFLSKPGEPLPGPAENQSYQVTVKLESNDPNVPDTVVRQKRYVPGTQPVVKDSQVSSNGDVVQYVTYRSGTHQYTRRTYEDAKSLRRHVAKREVAKVERASLTSYERDPANRPAAAIRPQRALLGLYMFRYEKRGTTTYQGRTVQKFVPVTGWNTRVDRQTGARESLYVRETEGEVLVDPDSGAILKATVSGSVIEANTWNGVMTGDAVSITVHYTVDTDIETVSRPPWVDVLNSSRDGYPAE